MKSKKSSFNFRKRNIALFFTGVLLFSLGSGTANLNAQQTVTVIDDFNDGDVSDYVYFGGDNAGGGIGAPDDRPQEGSHYLSTGWGAGGLSGGFFGGIFKNFDDMAQPAVPADPYINFYVYNQSNGNSGGYTLEVTIREDLDGNGWDGEMSAEESFRLDTAFTSADYNDTWTLVSAPLSDFNRITGTGDGVFTGALDQIVLVIAGVPNADVGTTVEADFDYFVFTDGAPIAPPDPPAPTVTVIDDFNDGDVSDYVYFGGDNAGGGIGALDDRPQEGSHYLSTGWGAGGLSGGFFGGIFKNFDDMAQPAVPADPYINFYVYNQSNGNSGGYTLEVTIREDLDGNGWDGEMSAEESFRLDTAFTSADYNDTWTLVSAPLSDFNRITGTGDGVFTGALDQIVLVIAGVPNADVGTTVEADFDYFVFTDGGPLSGDPSNGGGDDQDVIQDYENGAGPATACPPNTPVIGFCTFNGAESSVSLSTTSTPPASVPGVSDPNSVLQMDIDSTAFAGFIEGFEENGEPAPQDWSLRGGISVYMYGQGTGSQMFIDILENRNPGSTTDDAERYTVAFVDDFTGWQELQFPFNSFVRKEVGNGAPADGFDRFEVHGYAFGALDTSGAQTYYFDNVKLYGEDTLPTASIQFTIQNTFVVEGTTGQVGVRLNRALGPDDPETVSIDYATERSYATPGEEYTPTSGTLTFTKGGPTELFFDVETFDDSKFEGDEQIVIRLTNPVGAERGSLFQGSVLIDDNDSFDENMLDDFVFEEYLWESNDAVTIDTVKIEAGTAAAYTGQDQYENVMEFVADPGTGEKAIITRDFPLGQDWTGTETIDFWFKGTGSGNEVSFVLKDNRAPDPGVANWELVWADEFDDAAGSQPNPTNWGFEIGDTTPDGKNGWGNEELQYYTDSADNAAMDGNGNLVITLSEADGSQECYYGPCEFESARLLTQNRAEFAYGRIESRLKVPDGGSGLWPAFWSLGTDITYNPWPGAGEIDIMEYVSRLPNEAFGTIHGPGYAGGASFGGILDFGEPVYNDYHTFTVEWEPEKITWYINGQQYHQATPADVAPNEWVFEKPFFLLLNFAIGGNFGGAIDPTNTYPQEYLVDYVRVYQGPDSAERFETTFIDDSTGWQMISIPVTDFVRSSEQPTGAPSDGLGLTEVWGYALEVGDSGTYQIDQVRRESTPAPTTIIVTNTNDSGDGSLRDAIDRIAENGTIVFDGPIQGQTIVLTSGQLEIERSMTIAGTGVTVSGGNISRVMRVDSTANVTINDIIISDGVGAPQGGGILNNGVLTLNNSVVTNNAEVGAPPVNFEFGGGGIYNSTGATLNLNSSTVSNNEANNPGGGVYGFFGSTININGSTIFGNVSYDVAGGLRALGTVNIMNSTFSDNTSTAWHGGAAFLTDGTAIIQSSTFTNNHAPDGTAGGLMVASFGNPVTVEIRNNIIADNGLDCQIEGAATLTSLGNNLVSDASCALDASDVNVGSGGALLGPLADNSGPTMTHALLADSPAIDTANAGACPGTDQRGVSRPQGAGCDIGAFELEPSAPSSIQIEVWDDLNGDGLMDVGEPMLDGIQVDLIDFVSKSVVMSTTTSSGIAEFTTADGYYRFEVVLPSDDYTITLKDQGGNEEIDSDIGQGTGLSAIFLVESGNPITDLDAGLWSPVEFAIDVWEDLNGNGLQDGGEPSVDDVTIQLVDKNDVVLDEVQSLNGMAMFSSAPTGVKFWVKAILPGSGYAFSKIDAEGNRQDDIDSDVLRATGRSGKFKFNQGGVVIDDFGVGLIMPGTLKVTVWEDLNGDGLRGETEALLDGVTVNLLAQDDTVVETILTDESGMAQFAISVNVFYRIVVDVPVGGYAYTLRDVGDGVNEEIDSDVNPNSGRIPLFRFKTSSVIVDDIGAGFIPLPSE
ncbi:MAG: SdrD B-like domain-containing protein [Chloroflexota bacterium]